jgi:hypothetical protein
MAVEVKVAAVEELEVEAPEAGWVGEAAVGLVAKVVRGASEK